MAARKAIYRISPPRSILEDEPKLYLYHPYSDRAYGEARGLPRNCLDCLGGWWALRLK